MSDVQPLKWVWTVFDGDTAVCFMWKTWRQWQQARGL